MNSLLNSTSDAVLAAPAEQAAARTGIQPIRRLLLTIGGVRAGFVVVPMLSFWLAAVHHLDARTVATVMVGFGTGWAASAPVGGWLSDHIGARATIATSSLIAAGAYLLLGAVHQPILLTAAAALTGASFDAYRPPLQAALAAHTDGVDDAAAQRGLYLVMNASRLASCLLGAALVGYSWTILFWVNAAANLALTGLVLRQPESLYPRTSHPQQRPRWAALTDRRLLAITATTLAFYMVHYQATVSLPVLLHAHGATAPAYALLLALDPAVVITVQLLARRWLAHVRPWRSCAVGILLVAAGLSTTGLTGTLTVAALAMPVWVAGEVLFLTAAPAVVAAIAPAPQRGSYFGIWAATQGSAAIGAPLLAAAVTGPALWLIVATLAAAGSAGCVAAHHQPARP